MEDVHKAGFRTHAVNRVLQCGEAGNVLIAHSITDKVWLLHGRLAWSLQRSSAHKCWSNRWCHHMEFCFFPQAGAQVAQATHSVTKDDPEPL